eukprot:m.242055 g.242055  ORF g.242055 m.242055 type:complete len:644 (+) comp40209_c0_seq12:324-2255(+)
MSQVTVESPEDRWGHLSAIFDQTMLVWGGVHHEKSRYFSHAKVWRLNLADDSWSNRIATFKRTEDLPHPSRGSRISIVGNRKIYQFGGLHWPSRKDFNDLHKLDGFTLEWEKIIPTGETAPKERSSCGMCVLGDKIVIMGGSTISGILDDVWQFSLSEGFWSHVECKGKQPSGRWGHTLTAINENQAALIGGYRKSDSFLFNLAENEWVELRFPNETYLPTPRYNHSALCVNITGKGPLLVAFWGEKNPGERLPSAVIIDIANKNCSYISLPNIPPSSHQTVCSVFVKGKSFHFIRFGGWHEEGAKVLTKLKWDPSFPDRMDDIYDPSLLFIEEPHPVKKKAVVDLMHQFKRDELAFDDDEDLVGVGGYGEVYQARIKETGQTVALKIIFRRRRLRSECELLNKEATILFRIKPHCNIIGLIGICDSPRCYGLLTEFVDGGDLAQLLQSKNPEIENWVNRVDICQQIVMGMAHLHGNQPCVIHRDLKSNNVLIEKMAKGKGRCYVCKICDFGLAKMSEVSSSTEDRSDVSTPAGTVVYIAPERYHEDVSCSKKEREVTAKKSDVFSFGVLSWEVRERKLPFHGMVKDAISLRIKEGQGLPKGTVAFPEEYDELVSLCCAFNPDERPSFNEIVELLKCILPSES